MSARLCTYLAQVGIKTIFHVFSFISFVFSCDHAYFYKKHVCLFPDGFFLGKIQVHLSIQKERRDVFLFYFSIYRFYFSSNIFGALIY